MPAGVGEGEEEGQKKTAAAVRGALKASGKRWDDGWPGATLKVAAERPEPLVNRKGETPTITPELLLFSRLLQRLAENYRPDQPRDRTGRWTKGAGAGSVGPVRDLLKRFGERELTTKEAGELAGRLRDLTLVQLKDLAQEHGLSFRGRSKEDKVDRLSTALAAKLRQPAPPVRTIDKPLPPAPGRLLEGRPLAERIAAYDAGEQIRQQVLAHDLDRARLGRISRELEEAAAKRWEASGRTGRKAAAEAKQWQDRIDALEKESNQVWAESRLGETRTRDAVNRLLETDNPVDWNSVPGSSAGANQVADLSVARTWLRTKVRALPGDPAMEIRLEATPDPVNGRADYTYGSKRVRLSENSGRDTAVHELGHAIEDQIPGAGAAAREFLRYRTAGEPLVNLRQKFGGFYDANEEGRPDRFIEAFGEQGGHYVGKHYPSGATEVLSMGVEKLYADPLTFAKKDPEYFKFIVGVLRGELRGGI